MTSKKVSQLLIDLGVTSLHSRPKVSNDNPYSEANFKTIKYCGEYPDSFNSLTEARDWCEEFISYYNHEHRHSGISLHTPASVHSAPRTWSASSVPSPWPRPTPDIRSGSPGGRPRPRYPPRSGSTNRSRRQKAHYRLHSIKPSHLT
ncbi:hypothetical protein SHIRM173S_00837 [Streptomyces hirsutus]